MFSDGRKYFILFFIVAFVGGLIYAYRKDIKKNPKIFKGASKTLIIIILFFLAFVGIVKMMNFF